MLKYVIQKYDKVRGHRYKLKYCTNMYRNVEMSNSIEICITIFQKVRGHAAGQPNGQDDQDRPDPALQVELCEQKIFVQQMKEK